MSAAFDAFFLAADAGRPGERLCIHHPARGNEVRAAVLYVPPFAEEMNKSRRMAALQSRAFAEAGYEVLQIDLLGCGDSSGETLDATWDDWVADVAQGARWLGARTEAPLWLWGVRAGALLACAAAARLERQVHCLFWQAFASGKLLVQQFLRLKAAESMAVGSAKAAMAELKQQLAAGQPVEIAGYELSAALLQGFERAELTPPPQPGALAWLEVSPREETALLPASGATLEAWRQAGFEVHAEAVRGPQFWQTTEIEDAPALVAASLSSLGRQHVPVAH